MAAPGARDHTEATIALIRAARRYWLEVFPRICREARHWHRRAQLIPDPALRRLALEAQSIKRSNLEGAAAFAAFVPRAHLANVVRAQIAFQAAYDYTDTLAEQQDKDPGLNANQLHQALLVALDLDAPHINYYTHSEKHNDGHYLHEIVETCRVALATLPSHASVADSLLRFAKRIVAYQSNNLSESQGGHAGLARWATDATPPHADLRWWETAASAGSSLGVFALTAAAARRDEPRANAIATENAYLWIGALHSLLDSVVDIQEDAEAGQRSLLDFYASPGEAVVRIRMLACESLRLARGLPHDIEHRLILAAMTSHYLSQREADAPGMSRLARGVREEIGGLAGATMVVFRAQQAATHLHRGVAARSRLLRPRDGEHRGRHHHVAERR
jgi:tetraprenyl-beta-curcumene synthase